MARARKSGPRPGHSFGQAPVMVEYCVGQTKLRDLAMMAGVSPGALLARWKKAGSPAAIGPEFFDAYRADRRITRLDGVIATYEQISEKSKCSASAVAMMVRKHGRELTSAMFEGITTYRKKQRATPKYSRPTTPEERKKLDSIPGAGTWESQHLAGCGQNGYGSTRGGGSFSGTSSSSMGCYNGRQ